MSFAGQSVSELLELYARGDYNQAVFHELVNRNPDELFECAKSFLSSNDSSAQCAALVALGTAMGIAFDNAIHEDGPEPHRFQDSADLIAGFLNDPEPRLVAAAVDALDLHNAPAVGERIAPLAMHSDPMVRQAVACAFIGMTNFEGVLETLCRDSDDDVRATATSALGSQHDSPAIRTVLQQLLADSCEDVRNEAIRSLALWKDPTGLRLLASRFTSDTHNGWDKDAAREILGYTPAGARIEDLVAGLLALLDR